VLPLASEVLLLTGELPLKSLVMKMRSPLPRGVALKSLVIKTRSSAQRYLAKSWSPRGVVCSKSG
jgi:hypothetical protein